MWENSASEIFSNFPRVTWGKLDLCWGPSEFKATGMPSPPISLWDLEYWILPPAFLVWLNGEKMTHQNSSWWMTTEKYTWIRVLAERAKKDSEGMLKQHWWSLDCCVWVKRERGFAFELWVSLKDWKNLYPDPKHLGNDSLSLIHSIWPCHSWPLPL